ncbi:NlpC/P60 family protein [Nocardia sp. NBC_01009]|uniref:bifunctional WXG100 family type VII secretion target/C40 family peptidase n=1 Tax=Nocardia sp. NBC_01009 TaxID=2975996 RepID=UPI003868CB57|nr:NlpC/P60 family protein [Nocardia sp. NBC_01009]
MIDISVLAKPLLDLLSSFGSGVLPTDGPSGQLQSTSSIIDQIHAFGRNSINSMNEAWDGRAADSATAKALRVQTSAATISDRGNDMATVVDQAAAQVETGQKELSAIVESFVNTASALGPTIATPEGLAVLVGSAIDHLGQGLNVVGRVRSELDTQTASMTELTPPPSTAPATLPAGLAGGASALASGAGSGAQQLLSTLTSVGGSAGSMLTSMATPSMSGSTPSKSGSSPSTPGQQKPNSGSAGQTPDGKGVKVTLPDGSVVEAPNEQAAQAVRSALGAVGTPYVWGGTSPGGGLDCSGLTQYAYGEAGVELPRLAQEQGNGHMGVSPGDLMPGDLAVWDGHVAMVIGNGQFVEAGDPVQISSIRTENIGMDFYGFYRPTT